MIHEWRSYRLKPGAATHYLTLFAERGLPLVTRHLPLMGYWLAETGPLNVIHHLWSYADWSEREACRATLAGEEEWVKGFIPAAFALVEEQQNSILSLRAGSPAFETVLSRRRDAHAARAPGAPLFARECAALLMNAAPHEAVAVWDRISGEAGGPFALLPRRVDPLPISPTAGASHTVLRPLVFSPL